MITLVRQLTLIIFTASMIYVAAAIALYRSLTRKITRTDVLAVSAGLINPGLIFAAIMALGLWILDINNLKAILPVSSHIGRSTLADILHLPLSASLWAIGSASLIILIAKKLLFIWLRIRIPAPIATLCAGGSLFVSYLALYTGLSATKKNIIIFADSVEHYSFYTNATLGSICIILLVIIITSHTLRKWQKKRSRK